MNEWKIGSGTEAENLLFSSTIFLFAFLPVVLALYYLVLRGRRRAQNGLLLTASLFFYAWGEPFCVLLMFCSIQINYIFGQIAGRCRQQGKPTARLVTAAVGVNVAILFFFKYLSFVVRTGNALLGTGFRVPEIRLPIGISFFTFQALSYVLDVAWGRAEVQQSPFALGLYISFFPQLIAGPIVKYAEIAGQIAARRETWDKFSEGTVRFLTGLGKKVLLANQLGLTADKVFGLTGQELTMPLSWIGSVCYLFQIYYDFSGYSDMAVGLGLMFGFRFRENFRHPYAAQSVTDFWRRWHISLSSWFRDYVYIPLGGNRAGRGKQVRNLFVVWLLTGVWHGANWTFVTWGLGYFVLLCLEKFLGLGRGWPRGVYAGFTVLMVNLLFVVFRADSLSYAIQFLAAMFGRGGGMVWTGSCTRYLQDNGVTLAIAALFAGRLGLRVREQLERWREESGKWIVAWDAAYAAGLLAIAAASVSFLVKGTYNPFIYFNF